MNAAPLEPDPPAETKPPQDEGSWTRHRWWLLIALVFLAHIGLIFAFGERGPILPRRSESMPQIRLVTRPSELVALNDPTLFALPHPKGFAAATWLQIPQVEFPAFWWTESPRWLALSVEQLSDTFLHFMQTNRFARFELEALPAPELTMPETPPNIALTAQSLLRVDGDLRQRRLLNPAQLRSWPSAELLTNSVVQVLVDAGGNVFSPILVPPGSGSKDADQWALNFARTARFAPQAQPAIISPNPVGQLTQGALIFQWHTEPLPPTNAPSAKP